MTTSFIIPDETIINKIYLFRKTKVMLDTDLAELYQVETKRLNEQVKRNLTRFPEDFMFQLTNEEWENLKSQNATSSWGGRRKAPFVFTEHGVLMLSSILNSEKAIEINIQIVRIFTKMREMLLTHKDILLQLEDMKKSIEGQEDRVDLIYNYLTQFIKDQKIPRKEVGYKK
jgi:hypothetical protein